MPKLGRVLSEEEFRSKTSDVSRFGEAVRNLMTSSEIKQNDGLSINQAWLAKQTGYSETTISKVIRGSLPVSDAVVDAVASALQCSREQRAELMSAAGFVPNIDFEPMGEVTGETTVRIGENLSDEELENMTLMGAEVLSEMTEEELAHVKRIIDEHGDLKVIPSYPEDSQPEVAGETVVNDYPPLERQEVINLAGGLLGLYTDRQDVVPAGLIDHIDYKLYQRMVVNRQWHDVLTVIGTIIRRVAQDEIKFFELDAFDPKDAEEFLDDLDQAWFKSVTKRT